MVKANTADLTEARELSVKGMERKIMLDGRGRNLPITSNAEYHSVPTACASFKCLALPSVLGG